MSRYTQYVFGKTPQEVRANARTLEHDIYQGKYGYGMEGCGVSNIKRVKDEHLSYLPGFLKRDPTPEDQANAVYCVALSFTTA